MTNSAEEAHSAGMEVDQLVDSAKQRLSSSKKPRRDPVVSTLVIIILMIVMATLLTVAYSLVSGVMGTGAPRTMEEKRILGARAQIDAGSKDRVTWLGYVLALTDDGQYGEAQRWIDKGEKTLKDQDVYQDMVYAQAYLYLAQGQQDKALKTADEAAKQIKLRHEQGKVESAKTGDPDPAYAWGLIDTYWNVLLMKAEIYESKKDWKQALKAYDEYLAKEKTVATVFAKRGLVKEKLGDKDGAIADFRTTVKFIPDNPDAVAGLKRNGVSQ